MEIDLRSFRELSLLNTYEFIFMQWLAGQTVSNETIINTPTVYLFGKLCTEVRSHYLSRKNAKIENITNIEKNCINHLTVAMQIDEKKLRLVYESLLIEAEKSLKQILKK